MNLLNQADGSKSHFGNTHPYHETWIDSLKGIAILFILAVHCGTQGLSEKLARLVISGGMWVQLFLLISVLLCMNSFSHLANGAKLSRKETILWIVGKFVRLAPLYFLAIACAIVFVGGAPYYLGSEGHITIGNALSHLLFLHGLFPHYANSILAVEWYIGIMALFYLALPTLLWRISDLTKAFVALAVSIPVCHFLTVGAYTCVLPRFADHDVFASYFSMSWPIASIPTILLGVLICHLRRIALPCTSAWKKASAYAALMLFVLFYHGLIKGETVAFYIGPRLLFALAFAFLIAAGSMHSLPIVDNVVFRFLGKHSYGIYLFHMMFILPERVMDLIGGWVWKYFVCLVCSIVVTLLAEKVVDEPCQKLWKKIKARV